MVTMRSSWGTKLDSTLSSVVLPVPVPPDTRMFSPPSTAADSTADTAGVKVPISTRSAAWNGSLANFRMVRIEPSSDSGGTMTFTREPSGRRASTIGTGLIDPPADLVDDAVDDPPQVLVRR